VVFNAKLQSLVVIQKKEKKKEDMNSQEKKKQAKAKIRYASTASNGWTVSTVNQTRA
jgi:hypothetical protein